MRIIDKEAEAHLIELLNLVRDNRQGWQVIAFAFSKLLDHYRNEYQLKIAINLMNDLLGDLDGAIYLCEDGRIFVMVRNFSGLVLDKMIFQLRYLFMDDPLAYTTDGDENPEFATVHNMEFEWESFTASAKRDLVNRVRKIRAEQRNIPHAAQARMESGEPMALGFSEIFPVMQSLTPANLVSIERDMREMDLSPAIRRQPICASLPNTPARTVFDEMYINVNHLRQALNVQIDLRSNRNLFRYLTRTLDLRMLDTIQRAPARYLINPVSLNLNVETLLSNRFAEFDAAVKPGTKVSIVIEIQLADVFTDIDAFMTAKDVLHRLGYRICLDGTTEQSFPQIDRSSMGFDLVKLMWNADHKTEMGSAINQRVAEAVKRCGENRVILTRCDSIEAVEYGQEMGITLFQGRYLDGLVQPDALVEN